MEFGNYVKFNFYKIHRDWRFLSDALKGDSLSELTSVLDGYAATRLLRTYSRVGTRSDADSLVWQTSLRLDNFHEIAVRISSTKMDRYLDQIHSFLAQRRNARYRHGGSRLDGPDSVDKMYPIVYPMVKRREWCQLREDERQQMMNDHFRVGHKYSSVDISTAYSFGLDDQECALSFETNEPSDLVSLVMELREVEGGFFTDREMPIFTAFRMRAKQALEALG